MHVDYLFYCNSYMKTNIGIASLKTKTNSTCNYHQPLSLHKSTVISGFVYCKIEQLKACICNLRDKSMGLILCWTDYYLQFFKNQTHCMEGRLHLLFKFTLNYYFY